MATMITNGNDVVSFLKEQHRQVKELFEKVGSTHGEERTSAFFRLRRLLAIHETAEEQIVHPAARRALPDGDRIVEARLREENEAKKALAELEKLSVNSAEFDRILSTLKTKALAHAESEEQQEFERLGNVLDAPRLSRMRRAVEIAEAIAPTRPHPGVESAVANFLTGPFAAMIDRSRDALSAAKPAPKS